MIARARISWIVISISTQSHLILKVPLIFHVNFIRVILHNWFVPESHLVISVEVRASGSTCNILLRISLTINLSAISPHHSLMYTRIILPLLKFIHLSMILVWCATHIFISLYEGSHGRQVALDYFVFGKVDIIGFFYCFEVAVEGYGRCLSDWLIVDSCKHVGVFERGSCRMLLVLSLCIKRVPISVPKFLPRHSGSFDSISVIHDCQTTIIFLSSFGFLGTSFTNFGAVIIFERLIFIIIVMLAHALTCYLWSGPPLIIHMPAIYLLNWWNTYLVSWACQIACIVAIWSWRLLGMGWGES